MSDNKNKQDGRDAAQVDSQSASEVEYVHQQFPSLSHQEVVAAIEAAGPYREAIYAYIRKKHSIK